jgi:hypothetical protein
MKDDKFHVRPLREYGQARYPSMVAAAPPATEPAREEEETRHHPLEILLAAVLVLGISTGLIGCFSDYKTDACAMGLLPRDENGNCVPPDPEDDCQPGVLFCDDGTLMSCNQDGPGWSSPDCDAYCQETLDPMSTSRGCDAGADDPCQCEYDIIDGDVAVCEPGDLMCTDAYTLATCVDWNWVWEEQDCHEYCRDLLGPDAYSIGCDALAEDPCQCQYDVVVGVMPECSPGAFQCSDEDTVVICEEDAWTWTEHDCDTWCTDTFGEDYYAEGCDPGNESDNPCGCKYGIVDGEPAPP